MYLSGRWALSTVRGVVVRMVLGFDATAIFVAIIGSSALTALIGVIGQRMMASGRVRTTNADELWKQEERISRTRERDLDRCRGDLELATEQVFVVRTKALAVEERAMRATGDVVRMKARLSDALARVKMLEAENRRLREPKL